ncbi:hypothetical protein ACI2LF_31290 [Kribbella sp. NPDC020789]
MTRHSDPAVLEALDLAWDPDEGFLGRLRSGDFSEELGNEYVALLQSIEIDSGERIDPDFVRLVWFAPLFAEWQRAHAIERGADVAMLDRVINLIRERLLVILGSP